jgi:hypothetical protein
MIQEVEPKVLLLTYIVYIQIRGSFEAPPCYVTAGTFTRRGLSRLPYDKTQVQGI